MAVKNMVSGIAAFTDSQIAALNILCRSKAGTDGMTIPEIEEAGNLHLNAYSIGPKFRDDLEKYPDSLAARGMVKAVYSEDKVTRWVVTAKGRSVVEKIKVRKDDCPKVDAGKLDTVVIKFRSTRTYGIELYTDADMKEIKAALGVAAEGVTLDSLRNQIANRRKQGAYSDKAATFARKIAATIRDFGPEGIVAKILTAPQVAKLRALKAE